MSTGEFEVVFARAVLHHTSDLELACSEYFRVLKPGGIFLALREHVISRESDLPRFFDIHPLHKLYGGENAYLLDRYLDAIKHSGFKQVDVLSPWHSPINYSPYSLPSLKVELAQRASLGITFLYHIIKFVLDIPGVWNIARYLLRKLDDRPGRLYSFIAEKI
jgi:SAM-dependent methyltransferase